MCDSLGGKGTSYHMLSWSFHRSKKSGILSRMTATPSGGENIRLTAV